MLDRINMTCPQCGSTEGYLSVVSDPVLSSAEAVLNDNEHVLMCSTCLDCGFFRTGWVHVRPLVNLLRAYHCSNVSTLRNESFIRTRYQEKGWEEIPALSRFPSLSYHYPTLSDFLKAEKPWLSKDRVLKTVRLALCWEVKLCLTHSFPDVYAWFNRKPGMNLVWGPLSRSSHENFLQEKTSHKDVWAVFIALLRNKKDGEDVPTIAITDAIRSAYAQPLAS